TYTRNISSASKAWQRDQVRLSCGCGSYTSCYKNLRTRSRPLNRPTLACFAKSSVTRQNTKRLTTSKWRRDVLLRVVEGLEKMSFPMAKHRHGTYGGHWLRE